MRELMLAVAVVLACGLSSGPVLLQERGGEDETGPYEVVPNWPQQLARPGYALGPQAGVFAETPNRIILAEATGGRTQKFRPRPGADRSRLIGRSVVANRC